ncbi:CDP-glycerol glycerophosphotransferase family protein [Desulfovibrio sp. JC022]|uniref:CDP-glycerol glycerophosphotransferase family protein n=1 Tax=Desulfovibrio sp. JC022 TaxID=2593642 RepID=UPI0013D5268A|nr:CDP-glycerol glycerophosphotransferase family protein [Desulfovibrio sp. JC022]
MVKSPVMLSTTPNIGTDGYPLKRSPYVQTLIHIFHSISDTSNYHLGALDHYDVAILAGKHEERALRTVEKKRGLKAKKLVALGVPYLDLLHQQVSKKNKAEQNSVLIAPSWGSKGCFAEYGTDFVKDLCRAGFNITIRLHPQSYISEPGKVKEWEQSLTDCDGIAWDTNLLGTDSMEKSSILISDSSSIRYDYAFLYSKPVITLSIPLENRQEYESVYQDEVWSEKSSSEIGRVVDKTNIKQLPELISKTINEYSPEDLARFRDKSIANFGCSSAAIVKFIINNYLKD